MSNEGGQRFPWLTASAVLLVLMAVECGGLGVLHIDTQGRNDNLVRENHGKSLDNDSIEERKTKAEDVGNKAAELKARVGELEAFIAECKGSDLLSAFEVVLNKESGVLKDVSFEVDRLEQKGCRFEFEGLCSTRETLEEIVSALEKTA